MFYRGIPVFTRFVEVSSCCIIRRAEYQFAISFPGGYFECVPS